MVLTYDVIKSNFSVLDKIKFDFPEFCDKVNSKSTYPSNMSSFDKALKPYVDFARWVDSNQQSSTDGEERKVIYDNKLDFEFIREVIANGCVNSEVGDQIRTMTKTRFNNLLKNHQKFEKLNGIRHSNRVQRKSYNRNFTGFREVLIVNWAIQNAIDISPTIGKYYRMSLPTFLGTSVGYSNQNTSELYKRIDHFISTLGDLDLTNVNYSDVFRYLQSSLVENISSNISTSRVKCLDNDKENGLIEGDNYNVDSTSVNGNVCPACGSLHDIDIVYHLKGFRHAHNSKKFKRLSVHRKSILDEILES